MIMVREEGESVPEAVEYRHGLTPPMRDARRRRFRREPDLNVISVKFSGFFIFSPLNEKIILVISLLSMIADA